MLDSFIAKMYVYIYQKHTEKIQNDLSFHKWLLSDQNTL